MAGLADFVVVLHLAFIVFAVGGGLLVLRWPSLAWLHLPALGWAAYVEFSGSICPLTPLENWLRADSDTSYAGGFIDHHVVPVVYPPGLTRNTQMLLGTALVAANAVIYGALWWRIRSTSTKP